MMSSAKKEYRINIKGNIPGNFTDPILKKKFVDVKYGNGVLIMMGTEEEYDEMLDWLVKNEGKLGFKII